MNIKKISGIAAGFALAFGAAAPASALTLTAGELKFTFNAFDAGTIGYGNDNGVKCTNIAACDAAGTKKAPGAIGSEDTWGIFSVQSISNMTTGKEVFVAGQGGQYLTGIFGGITDTRVQVSTATNGFEEFQQTLALGTGGWLNMYLTGENYNSSYGPSGRIGEQGYNGITNVGGQLALSAVFGKGVLGGAPEYNYASSFANNTIGGSAQGYLDVTGGSMKGMFDTNSQRDPNGNYHDLYLKTTYSAAKGAAAAAGWTVDASGDVLAEVPEPGSLALLGLGIAGLAAMRRRRA